MDVSSLDAMVQFYLRSALAPSTQRTYSSAQKRYLVFCSTSSLAPLPLSDSTLCRYVAHLAREHIKHKSIKTYLSALRNLQIMAQMGDPFRNTFSLLEQVLNGIKREQAKSGSLKSRERLPITPEILRHIRRVWERNSTHPDMIMLWAACCTCFFGFLRCGEITVPSVQEFDPGYHLSYGDVRLDSTTQPSVVDVNIKASKTDPFRQGVRIYLGKTDNDLCPVAAVAAYLASRSITPGPFFHFQNGAPLTRSSFVSRVTQALTTAGIDSSKYSGHSFRIGAASTAAARGIDDSLIKTLGRWKSSAYLLYVRIPRERLASLCPVLSSEQ